MNFFGAKPKYLYALPSYPYDQHIAIHHRSFDICVESSKIRDHLILILNYVFARSYISVWYLNFILVNSRDRLYSKTRPIYNFDILLILIWVWYHIAIEYHTGMNSQNLKKVFFNVRLIIHMYKYYIIHYRR